MENNVEILTEVGYVHCSPLIHQPSHLILNVYQVGQTLLPLGESMLTTPNDFLVLHMSGNGFKD